MIVPPLGTTWAMTGTIFTGIPKILRLALIVTVCIFAGSLAPTVHAQMGVSGVTEAFTATQVATVAPKLAEEPADFLEDPQEHERRSLQTRVVTEAT